MIGVWRGVVGPPSLPPAALSFWSESIRNAVQGASWSDSIERHAWTPNFLGPSATADFMKTEDQRMNRALLDFGLLD